MCVGAQPLRLVEEAQVDMQTLDYGGYNALDYAAACHWHHPDRPPMLADGKLAPMDIASYLKSQGMKYTWFGAALAEDIDRLWEFLDNGQDRGSTCCKRCTMLPILSPLRRPCLCHRQPRSVRCFRMSMSAVATSTRAPLKRQQRLVCKKRLLPWGHHLWAHLGLIMCDI